MRGAQESHIVNAPGDFALYLATGFRRHPTLRRVGPCLAHHVLAA